MTITEAITKLHEFKSSQEVAEYLKSECIKSGPADDIFLKCPIDHLIEVWTGEQVSTGMKDILDYNHGERHSLPQSVIDFNRDFALGKYPGLIQWN